MFNLNNTTKIKKVILLIVLIGVSFGVNAQDSSDLVVRRGTKWWVFHIPIGSRTSLHIAPRYNWAKETIFHNDGKVSFSNNISVKGKIESKGVKITNSPTADFVFEKSYKLLSLDYIENYINENKHLPEIASAKEMKKMVLILVIFKYNFFKK